MEIRCDKLVDAIGKVVPAIAQKELFEQADKLAFEDGNLISYNDVVSIFHPLDGSRGITGAIDGRRLHQLLNRLSDSTIVSLNVNGGDEMEVKGGRTTAHFSIQPVRLPFSEIDKTGQWQDLPEGFLQILDMLTTICAREVSRPILTCVSFTSAALEASDGYRATRYEFSGTDFPQILLPVTPAELITKYKVKQICVGETGEWVRFKTEEGTEICARLAAGEYPNLSGILHVEGEPISLPRNLVDVIHRAHIFSKRLHRIDEEVQISLRKGKRIVVKAFCDGARFEESLGGVQPAEAEFSITPDFLAAILSEESFNGCILGEGKIKFIGRNWQHVIALR